MARHFALTIRLHDRRYHGASEWPPAPARVFQALVAGAARGRHVPEEAARALTLLESLPPPVVAAPSARRGLRLSLFVPNNDLDAVEGDPDRIGEVRIKKTVQPRLLESDAPFLYVWPLSDGAGNELTALADGLYQFGRGVDPAWAVGETIDDEELAARLRSHRGTVHRPSTGEGSSELAVPTRSSFASIVRRFDASLVRLRPGANGVTNFVQPPKAHWAMVRYDGTPTFHLFELRRESEPVRSSAWATWRAAKLVEQVRDTAASTLKHALPERIADVERVIVGRKRDGADSGPSEQRVRFIPLPSVGHSHADQSIRRMLVQIPRGSLTEEDVLWSLTGRPLFDPETGELGTTTLVAVPEDEMARRYCASARVWRSVTPLALTSARRRRIEPLRIREEAKSAGERANEEAVARRCVGQALRHAGVNAALVRARVQREPFEAHGARAERFAESGRFPKEALWHVELELDRPIRGPLVLGDGRFLGLGVMLPKADAGAIAFAIEPGCNSVADATVVTRALRRAVMARVQATLGSRESLLPYFSGHRSDGTPTDQPHLAFSFDPQRSHLLVIAPHALDGRAATRDEREHLRTLEESLVGFTQLRAGRAGLLSLARAEIDVAEDPLFAPSRVWETATTYRVTRHLRRAGATAAIAADVRAECARRGLPRPDVEVLRVDVRPSAALGAHVRLRFRVAVAGPIVLGRDRFLGGGLFAGAHAR